MASTQYLLLSATALLLIAGVAPTTAFAQTAAASADDKNAGLEEIVVTAERRSERLQTVPLAVSAFTPQEISTQQIQNSEDLMRYIPNVIAFSNTSASQANYYFRGVGTPDGIQTFDPPIVTYIDEVPLGRIVGSNLDFADIDRVEVLRGPQGTLFGRNTTGGAIAYYSHRPVDAYRVVAEGEAGSYSHFSGKVFVDAPLTDTLYSTFSAYALAQDGVFHSAATQRGDYGALENYSFRAGLRWMPNESIDWFVTGDYSRQDGFIPYIPQNYAAPISSDPASVDATLFKASRTINLAQLPCENGGNALEWALNNCGANVALGMGVTSNLAWTVNDHLVVTAITGVRESDDDLSVDLDGNDLTNAVPNVLLATQSRFQQFSQEVKASGDILDGRIKFVGGVFLYRELDQTNIAELLGIGGPNLFSPGNYYAPYDNNERLNNETTSVAGYLQTDIKILDDLTLTTGARYTHDRKRVQVVDEDYPSNVLLFDTSTIAGVPAFSANKFTPKIGLEWQITPDVMTYFSYTKGFKSGGWNGRAGSALGFIDYRDEKANSYEVGARTEFLDHHFRVNVTGFIVDYKDLQINTAYIPAGQTQEIFVTGDGGDAQDKGVDLETEQVWTPEFHTHVNIGLQDSKFTRLTPGAIASGFTLGGPTAESPPFTLEAGLNYTQPISEIAGSAVFVSNLQFVPSYNPLLAAFSARTENNTYITASLTYQPDDADYDMGIECKNCLFHYYLIDPYKNGGGLMGPPPYLGVKARYHFTAAASAPESPAAPYVPPPVQVPSQAVAHSYLVFFDFNKSDLTPQAAAIVDQAAKNAAPAKATELVVTGHTDTVGSDAYNLRLSRRRAESVGAELEKQGVPSSEIEIVAKGKHDLLVPTAEGVREPRNRRVTIVYGGAVS
jgi:iron complex outermembrane receptor protein